ncbi:pyrimidine reductase family protein [soil metagenome]
MSALADHAAIDRLWPDPAEQLSDDDLLAGIDHEGFRVNFVSSIDGAGARDGRSGGLSGAADQRFFELLRRVSDVVLVGAGTVRDEGYSDLRVSEASVAWRLAHGRSEHPVFAIVTRSLELDPASTIFAKAPVRPVIITAQQAEGRARFEAVADVVVAGDAHVNVGLAVEALRERGLRRILCEGGPSLFGSALAEDAVDELCLTIEPSLDAGAAPRIARGETPPRDMQLASVLRSGSVLLLRYVRG